MESGPPLKPLFWMGSSRKDLKCFPAEVQDEMGYALRDAQFGGQRINVKVLAGFGGAGGLEARDRYAENRYGAHSDAPQCGPGALPGVDGGKMRKKTKEIIVEESSGNVFADLGLANAEERLAKADLAITIAREIESRGLSQADAAQLLGVAQPDISNLTRGRLAGYSIERLTRLLNALGQDVEIRISPTRGGKERGHLRVAVG